jgi:hypothetical protein
VIGDDPRSEQRRFDGTRLSVHRPRSLLHLLVSMVIPFQRLFFCTFQLIAAKTLLPALKRCTASFPKSLFGLWSKILTSGGASFQRCACGKRPAE